MKLLLFSSLAVYTMFWAHGPLFWLALLVLAILWIIPRFVYEAFFGGFFGGLGLKQSGVLNPPRQPKTK